MYKKILLPIDGSKNSEKAIKHAISIADNEAEIFILFATDSKSLTSIPEEAFDKEDFEEYEEHGKIATEHVDKLIHEINDELNTGKTIKTEPIIVEGNPTKIIVKAIEKKEADVVLIASSGKNPIDKFLIGSITEKIIQDATVPVIVIPAKAE